MMAMMAMMVGDNEGRGWVHSLIDSSAAAVVRAADELDT